MYSTVSLLRPLDNKTGSLQRPPIISLKQSILVMLLRPNSNKDHFLYVLMVVL